MDHIQAIMGRQPSQLNTVMGFGSVLRSVASFLVPAKDHADESLYG